MPPSPSSPLAVYHERVIRGFALQRREFQLFADRIEIHLRWRAAATDISLPLADFRPVAPTPGRTRLTIYKRATIATLAFFLAVILLLLVDTNLPAAYLHLHRPLMGVVTTAAILMAISLLLVNRYRKPVEVAKFLNTEGKVALDILKSGPDIARFDTFTKQVTRQISTAARA